MSLHAFASAHGMGFGVAVAYDPLVMDASYRDAIRDECGVLVAENAMKFGPLCPNPGEYNWTGADAIAAFAAEIDASFRGHTLMWHTQMPGWLQEGEHDFRAVASAHFEAVTQRYRGRVASWDVLNEIIADDAGPRDTPWLRQLGAGYAAWAFKEAHRLDPDAELVYNDYGIDDIGPKSDAVYDMLRELIADGVPVHAVGLQGHLELEKPPEMESVRANIERFRALGLRVHVTEVDIRIIEPFTPNKIEGHAQLYGDFARTCREAGVTHFLTWGLTDRYSWVPGFFTGTGYALLWDEDYARKPAYDAVVAAWS